MLTHRHTHMAESTEAAEAEFNFPFEFSARNALAVVCGDDNEDSIWFRELAFCIICDMATISQREAPSQWKICDDFRSRGECDEKLKSCATFKHVRMSNE